MLTSRIEGTDRQTSVTVSSVGIADAGQGMADPQFSSLTFSGKGMVTRISPFWMRFE